MHVHNDDPNSIFEVTVIIVCQLYLDGGNNKYAIIIVIVYTKSDKDNIRINNMDFVYLCITH